MVSWMAKVYEIKGIENEEKMIIFFHMAYLKGVIGHAPFFEILVFTPRKSLSHILSILLKR